MGKRRTSQLTTVEMRGTQIGHMTAKTRGIITGTYQGGFKVFVPKEKKEFGLPFSQVSEWNKFLKEPKRR